MKLGKQKIIFVLFQAFLVLSLSVGFVVAQEKQGRGTEAVELGNLESMEMSTYLARIYKKKLICVTDIFLADYREVKDPQILEDLFHKVTNERLGYTDLGNWEKARLIFTAEDPEIYAVNADNKTVGSYEVEIASKINEGYFVHPISSESSHRVGVTLFNNLGELGKTPDGIDRKVGCLECHEKIKGRDDLEYGHLKGALVFTYPRRNEGAN